MSLSPQQMEMRRTRVGSSEIAALLKIDPYKSALDVFMEKSLPPAPYREDHRSWGMDLEPAILAHHVRARGYTIAPAPGSLAHPTQPLCATPDALVFLHRDEPRIDLQCKNDQGHGSIEWGEPGTDDAPLLYVAQVQVELGVLRATGHDMSHGEIVVSIRGAPPVAFMVTFDEELFGNLAEIAAQWVKDHLETGKPPDGSIADQAEYVRRRYGKHDERMLEPTDELSALVQAVATMRASRKALEEELTAAETRLKEAIGDAAGIAGLCTWKVQTRKAHTVKESSSRVLRLLNQNSKEG